MPFAASVIRRIEDEVAPLSVEQTPFMRAWMVGDLNRDDLRLFATQYYHQIASFPRYVSRLHSITDDGQIRSVLLEVLVAAEGGSPTLSDLWLRTCAALGLFSDTVRASEPTAQTSACVEEFQELCGASTVAGLAALYACTSQLPSLCRGMRDALEHHYGMNPGPGLQFFEVREYAGGQHAASLRSALENAIGTEDDVRTALDAALSAARALTALYDMEPVRAE